MTDDPVSGRHVTVRLKAAGSMKPSSRKWLTRQLNDPYVEAARARGYRSRAAFKLIELDEKYGLIGKGCRVVDLGAAPGGWTQIALDRGAAQVVGVDLLPIDPIPGAILLQGDFQDDAIEASLREALGGRADLVLSDMAPNTTGHMGTDHLRIMGLAELALDFALKTLDPGGAFVTKLFQGGAQSDLLTQLKQRFTTVKHAKPAASRKDSRELYLIATGLKAVAPTV